MVFKRVQDVEFRIEPHGQFTRIFCGSGGIVAEICRQQNSLNLDGHIAFPVLVWLFVRFGSLQAPIHKFLSSSAWASPRAFARKTRGDAHAVKQVVCEISGPVADHDLC